MHALDQKQLRRACDSAAPGFDAADFLCAEVRSRLLDCLNFMALEPQRILDLGCGTGASSDALRSRYPDAALIGVDWSEQMLAQFGAGNTAAALCADAHSLPLVTGSVDLVVANLLLPGCADPLKVFSEMRRVLRNPGLVLFTTLGPDSLLELRRAWSAVDTFPHVHEFADMHNIGDALVRAGFRDPVMHTELLTVNYGDPARLVADLRAIAATNFSSARRRGLTPPGLWRRFVAGLDAMRDEAGKFPVRVELITGQAWSGDAGIGVPMKDGEARFPLTRLRY